MKLVLVSTLTCLSLVAAACGGSSRPGASAAGTAATRLSQALAFARCMRTHGVSNFPDPNADGDFDPFRPDVSKQGAAAATETCKHLFSGGGTATPQQRQQKLAFGLKVAECLRRSGYPDFPDPRGGSQSLPAGVDLHSPRFQAAETSCETQARKALGLP